MLADSLMKSCGLSPTKSNLLALREAARSELVNRSRERCSRLVDYIRDAWGHVEPGRKYVHGWHIDAVCEHLEAITKRQIRNLIINIPPRYMKSLAVCVFWPTWVWITSPESQWLFSSYAQGLAIRDAVKSRRLIQSPWYQERWGDVYRLVGDQNQKARYENDRNGHRVSIGIGGQGTGDGGDFLVIDDPIKAKDAESDAIRGSANDFWTQTMSTRGNNPQTVCKVVIMQRLHEDDLVGHIQEEMKEGGESYEMLILPAEYEPRAYETAIGWSDPRTDPGELLWEERFSAADIAMLKKTLGERSAAGQLQQRPSPKGGAIYLSKWWESKNRWDAKDREPSNACIGRWLSLDTALKDEQQNDYTALGVYELWPSYRLAKRYAWWGRVQLPQLVSTISDEAVRWNYDGKLRGVVIEDKGSGTGALQTLKQGADEDWISDLLVAFNPQGSKEFRARQASLWCDRSMVLLPYPSAEVPWLMDWEDVLYEFPAVRFDDVVDEFTQIILYLEHYLAAGWQASISTGCVSG